MSGSGNLIKHAAAFGLAGVSGVGAIFGTAGMLAYDYQKRSKKRAKDNAADEVNRRAAYEEEQHQSLLRQELAAYRARAGASGLDVTTGSSKAIIDGIIKRNNVESSYAKSVTDGKLRSIAKNYSGSSGTTISDGLKMAASMAGSAGVGSKKY